jgi:rhamnose transport system substrate-binding protein
VKKRHPALRLLMVFMFALVGLSTGIFAPASVIAQDENTTCAGEPMIGAPAATPEGSPAAGDMASPAAEIDPATLNIAFLPKDIVNPYFATSAAGAQEAATELGGQFQQVGPQSANAAEQVTFIQSLTQQGVSAIVVSANDPDALAPALKDAMAQGIKVISYDSDVAPDARIAFANQADSEEIGRIQVQIMGKLLDCEGEIAILSAAATATNQNAWIATMEDELAKPGYENMTLVETAYGDDDPQKSHDKTIELLTAYPDLKGIISPTTVGITAAAQALEEEGRGGGSDNQVQLTGLNLPNQMRPYVESGTVQEFALWDPGNLGYLAYYMAAQAIAGNLTGEEGETFTAGKLGTYTVGPNGTVILGPPTIFDAENIGDYNF